MAASHNQTSGILVGQNKTKYWRSLAFGILSQIRIKHCPISNIGGKNFTAGQRLSAAVVVGIGDGGDDDDDDGDDGDGDDGDAEDDDYMDDNGDNYFLMHILLLMVISVIGNTIVLIRTLLPTSMMTMMMVTPCP